MATATTAVADDGSPFRSDCLVSSHPPSRETDSHRPPPPPKKKKVAIVTGGGSGIGYEVARQLVLHGCSGVILCGRREPFLRRAAASLREETRAANPSCTILYVAADVRDYGDCVRAVDVARARFGRLDVLVNGAAGNFLTRASDLSPNGFRTVMDIDAVGTFHMCRAAYELMSTSQENEDDDDDAVIINISATLQYGATWWQVHASAAKSAVDSVTRSLALEWGGSGGDGDDSRNGNGGDGQQRRRRRRRIRVNGIAPGPIADTPGTTKLAPNMEPGPATRQIQESIPLGRMGRASEIGHAVVYLCTARYVTGHVLVVDGGEWLYRPPIVPSHLVSKLSRQVESKSRAIQRPTKSPIRSKL